MRTYVWEQIYDLFTYFGGCTDWGCSCVYAADWVLPPGLAGKIVNCKLNPPGAKAIIVFGIKEFTPQQMRPSTAVSD